MVVTGAQYRWIAGIRRAFREVSLDKPEIGIAARAFGSGADRSVQGPEHRNALTRPRHARFEGRIGKQIR